MTIRTLAVVAALLAPVAVAAETVTLKAETAGATLHHATVDLSTYWTEAADGSYDLIAYYAPKNGAEGGRLQMTLVDGDSVTFGLPGQVGQMFTFAREAGVVTVSTVSTVTGSPEQLAMN